MTVLTLAQDPANGGGVAAVWRWYSQWMDLHRLGEHRAYYFDDFNRGHYVRRAKAWTPDSASIPRLLPRAHLPQYVAGRRLTRSLSSTADEAHVIGGSILQGMLAQELPSILWMATTIADERTNVMPYQRPPRRWLYRTTLPGLVRVEREVLRRSSRVLAMSPHTARLVAAAGVSWDRIEVRPVPVDTAVFRPRERERRGLLFVGRAADPRKGFRRALDLLEALPEASEEGLDVVSPGDPPPLALRQMRAGRLRWRGTVPAVAERFCSARLFLLLSHQEGLGIAAFEALSSGTPVLAMKTGGADELLERSGGAVLVDSEAELAAAARRLLADESWRKHLAWAGRSWCKAHLSAERFLADAEVFRL